MRESVKPKVEFEHFTELDLRIGHVISAPLADGTRTPSRILTIEAGALGIFVSVGQFALLKEEELVGRKVVFVANFHPRKIGKFTSEALVLGTPHPDSPAGQSQALPLWADMRSAPGDKVF